MRAEQRRLELRKYDITHLTGLLPRSRNVQYNLKMLIDPVDWMMWVTKPYVTQLSAPFTSVDTENVCGFLQKLS